MRLVLVLFLLTPFIVDIKADVDDAAFVEDFDSEFNTAEDTVPEAEDIKPVKPVILPPKPLPLSIPFYLTGPVVPYKVCICFKRMCYVPGLRNRFLGWHIVYKTGYVVYGNVIYRFGPCPKKPIVKKVGDE